MMQKVEVEAVDALRRRLVVEIPAEAVSAEFETTYSQLAQSARVPGFRRGRVPRQMLERMFGDRVRAEVHERLISRSYAEAVGSTDLPVVGRPDITTENSSPGEVLRYTATVEVKPSLDLPKYEGLDLVRKVRHVGDADVDGFLNRLRESSARLHPVVDRDAVQSGDVVTLNYEARVGQKIIGRGKDREVELGHNGFPTGFDERLTEAEVGKTLTFDLRYPDDSPHPELAGKDVSFVVDVLSVATKEVPNLDDDFAKTCGDCETVEQLRAKVREQLEGEAANQTNEELRRSALARLTELNDVPVPRAMIEQRLDALVEDVLHEWRQQRVPVKSETSAREKLRVDLEPRATEQVKVGLLLEAIAQHENLVVSEADVEGHVEKLVAQSGGAGERVRAFYEDPRARKQLQASLVQRAAIELIVARASVKDASADELIADPAQNG